MSDSRYFKNPNGLITLLGQRAYDDLNKLLNPCCGIGLDKICIAPCGGGGSLPFTQVAYGSVLNLITSDSNFTRQLGTLTQITDSFAAGTQSSIQLSSNIGGLGPFGAAMVHQRASGRGLVIAGDLTSLGSSGTYSVGLLSVANSTGTQATGIFNGESGQVNIGAVDVAGNATSLNLDPGGSASIAGLDATISGFFLSAKVQGAGVGKLVAGVPSNLYTFPLADGIVSQVMTTDGVGNLSWSTPASGVFTVKIHLLPAQINQLNTTPATLVPAQGAGKIVVPLSITENLVYGGTAYTTHTTLNYKIGTAIATIDASVLPATASSIYVVPVSQNYNGALANQPLTLTVSAGNPAAGNSPLDIYITYLVLTL